MSIVSSAAVWARRPLRRYAQFVFVMLVVVAIAAATEDVYKHLLDDLPEDLLVGYFLIMVPAMGAASVIAFASIPIAFLGAISEADGERWATRLRIARSDAMASLAMLVPCIKAHSEPIKQPRPYRLAVSALYVAVLLVWLGGPLLMWLLTVLSYGVGLIEEFRGYFAVDRPIEHQLLGFGFLWVCTSFMAWLCMLSWHRAAASIKTIYLDAPDEHVESHRLATHARILFPTLAFLWGSIHLVVYVLILVAIVMIGLTN